RDVHGIKGEAAVLGLRTIESQVHEFESLLAPLRGRKELSGEDFIPLAVAMNDLHEATAKVWRVIDRVQNFARGKVKGSSAERQELRELLDQIEHLTLRVASDLGKKAKINISAPTGVSLPASLLDFLRSTLPQLVRNAVAHGIEPVEQRQSRGKPHEGAIHCRIEIEDDGALHVSVEDDGAGISPQVLRRSIVDKGMVTATQAAAMTDKQVIAMIFEPGFSALDEAGIHAGRGDGLSVVKEAVLRWGGKLRISSQPNLFTRFILRLEKESWQCA
ncbi:MAG: cheA, partial [Proteobacteria bacterium]|nr:cheA [Pseudomonadota bacterium]